MSEVHIWTFVIEASVERKLVLATPDWNIAREKAIQMRIHGIHVKLHIVPEGAYYLWNGEDPVNTFTNRKDPSMWSYIKQDFVVPSISLPAKWDYHERKEKMLIVAEYYMNKSELS